MVWATGDHLILFYDPDCLNLFLLDDAFER